MINSIDGIDFINKIVLCRFDYNVPLEKGVVMDDTRITRSLPTIRYLLNHGAKIIVTSHLGRPKGKINPDLSLEPVAVHLEKLLEEEVYFVDETVGLKAEKGIDLLRFSLDF